MKLSKNQTDDFFTEKELEILKKVLDEYTLEEIKRLEILENIDFNDKNTAKR